MKLRKGDKVEVMNKKEAPVSWCVAKVLSGNGQTYRVQYDACPGMSSEQMTVTVSRKFVRPCPPVVQDVENCVVGDIVEVFHDYAWKVAVILKIMEGRKEAKSKRIPLQASAGRKQYYVRLIGNSQELVVNGLNIRMRHAWQDDKWILIGKNSRIMEDATGSKPSTSTCYQQRNAKVVQFNGRARNQTQHNCTDANEEAGFMESNMISSRSQKRMSPYGSSAVETHNGHAQKLRVLEKDGKKQRVITAPVLEKVDAVIYPKETLGEKYMHAPFKIISTGYNQNQWAKLNDNAGYSGVRNSESSSDSDSCSVGSCSVADQYPTNFYIPVIPQSREATDAICSDAESCYGSGSDRSSTLPPKEEVEVSIRRLELCAYRRTLEALYASGPLSWEQEALLTNLRIMLHISNDEHLMELKNLISAKTPIHVR